MFPGLLKIKNLLSIIYIVIPVILFPQEKYPQSYFISPLDIPLNLSGTFGELRPDHFHSGIDLRTGEVEGHKVYAVAEGFISRVKVSSGGYGKALYIIHPNGYVSVYGHLQRFEGAIAEYVKNEQYRRESFELDIYPETGTFRIEKGEVIALSGNSGGSGGPHLHFEIRKALSEKPVNPLLFGFKVEDNSPPVINSVKIYPADEKCLINNKKQPLEINVQGNNGHYKLSGIDTVTISGEVYFGIHTIDLFNNGNNKNGVFSIHLILDTITVFQQQMESIPFDETRYINSLIDYPERIMKNRWIQKSFIQPNNHLSIYNNVINRGIIDFSDQEVYKIVYRVTDAAGNSSVLKFNVNSRRIENDTSNIPTQKNGNNLFSYQTANTFETKDILLELPENTLYDTLNFTYEIFPGLKNTLSPIHRLHYNTTPLHNYCNLSIRPDSIIKGMENKMLIVRIDREKGFVSAGGEWDNGFVNARIREFGNYCIVVDTIAPKIIPVNITNNKNISQQNSIQVKISDDLSGISNYRGILNDRWLLMDYDAKSDLLIYTFDERLLQGENFFELSVSDKKNNITKLKAKLVY